jgi:hypothetical protein
MAPSSWRGLFFNLESADDLAVPQYQTLDQRDANIDQIDSVLAKRLSSTTSVTRL